VSDFVLDASVALAWVLDNPIPPYAMDVRRALGNGKRGLVPALWHLEIANGLISAERRQDLVGADLMDALATIQATAAQVLDTDMTLIALAEALTNARSFQWTAYDSVYLNLAQRDRLPLATLDKRLRTAATRAGIPAMS
jgi:predicted nucleic acid-binding protein